MKRGPLTVLHRFDLMIAHRLNAAIANHRRRIRFLRMVSAAGGPTSWRVLATAVAGVLMLRQHRRSAYRTAVTMAGAAVLSGGTKALVRRSRPTLAALVDRPSGKSFPSGHALTSFVAVGLLVRLLWPACTARQRVLLLIAATVTVTAIGFSRLGLGVHFLTDVLGGWLLGAVWLLGVRRTFDRIRLGRVPFGRAGQPSSRS